MSKQIPTIPKLQGDLLTQLTQLTQLRQLMQLIQLVHVSFFSDVCGVESLASNFMTCEDVAILPVPRKLAPGGFSGTGT